MRRSTLCGRSARRNCVKKPLEKALPAACSSERFGGPVVLIAVRESRSHHPASPNPRRQGTGIPTQTGCRFAFRNPIELSSNSSADRCLRWLTRPRLYHSMPRLIDAAFAAATEQRSVGPLPSQPPLIRTRRDSPCVLHYCMIKDVIRRYFRPLFGSRKQAHLPGDCFVCLDYR